MKRYNYEVENGSIRNIKNILDRSGDVTERKSPVKSGRVSPDQSVKFNSVFDSRPLNAIDFNKGGGSISITPDELTETGTFSFTVNPGKVCIPRLVFFAFTPIYSPDTIASAITRITLNGEPLEENDALSNFQTSELGLYFVAREQNTIGIVSVRISTITVTARNLGLPVPFTPTFAARFQGNMLLSRNLPAQFESGGY